MSINTNVVFQYYVVFSNISSQVYFDDLFLFNAAHGDDNKKRYVSVDNINLPIIIETINSKL